MSGARDRLVSSYDVAIVGGAGHVGAPLAIVLASRGHRTLAYDIDHDALTKSASGELPFFEEGGTALLRRVLADGQLGSTTDPSEIRGVPIVVIAIGTPIDEFHNPKVDVIARCVDELLPFLSRMDRPSSSGRPSFPA